jgi:hypothetical protein
VLFVPTEDMWAVHDSGKKLAGTGATTAAILAAAERAPTGRRKDRRQKVGDNLLSYWRKEVKKALLLDSGRTDHWFREWFEGWLLRGENNLTRVIVVPTPQATRCAKAWNFTAFFPEGSRVRADSYARCLRNQIPNLAWRKWLFGWPPPKDVFVVSKQLQRLRHELSEKVLLEHLGFYEGSVRSWRNDERTRTAFEALSKGALVKEWEAVHEGVDAATRDRMITFVKVNSPEACCNRRQHKPDAPDPRPMSISGYYKEKKKAEVCGVGTEFEKYLRSDSPFDDRKSGMVVPGFFIPTREMLRFRDHATKMAGAQKIWSLPQDIPGFDEWFLDWTTPKAQRGMRIEANTLEPFSTTQRSLPVPAIGDSAPVPAAAGTGAKPVGRPADDGIAKRNKKIRADCASGHFASIADLARYYHISRGRATNIIHDRE